MGIVVPRVEGPSVQQQGLPDARYTARADDRGAQALAAGMRDVAGVAFEYAKAEQAKADEAAMLEAREQLSAWEREQFDPNNPNSVAALRGRDALGAGDKLAASFEERRAKIEASLRTDRQRLAFRRLSMEFGGQARARVDRYSAEQYAGYLQATEESALATLSERAATAGREGRMDAMATEVNLAHAAIDMQAQRLGLGPEVAELRKAQFTSGSLVATTNGLLERGDIEGAVRFYRSNADDMLEQDRVRMDTVVRNAEVELLEVSQSNEIMAQFGTGSQAVRAAERIGDPKLRDAVIRRIDAEASRQDRARRQAEEALVDRAYQAIFNADPAAPVEQAVPIETLARLSPRDRMALDNFQAARLRGEAIQTDPRVYAELSLMAPDELDKVDVNRLVLERKLHPDDAQRFRGRQEEIRNPKPGKFRWSSEEDMFRQQITRLGIAEDKEAVGTYRLALDRAVAQRESELDRSMTKQETWQLMNELAVPVMRERQTFWGRRYTEPARYYEVAGGEDSFYVDPAIVQRARDVLVAARARANLPPPTDADVSAFIRANAEQFNRGGSTDGR